MCVYMNTKGFVQIESPFPLPLQFTSSEYYLLKFIAPCSYIIFFVETFLCPWPLLQNDKGHFNYDFLGGVGESSIIKTILLLINVRQIKKNHQRKNLFYQGK